MQPKFEFDSGSHGDSCELEFQILKWFHWFQRDDSAFTFLLANRPLDHQMNDLIRLNEKENKLYGIVGDFYQGLLSRAKKNSDCFKLISTYTIGGKHWLDSKIIEKQSSKAN